MQESKIDKKAKANRKNTDKMVEFLTDLKSRLSMMSWSENNGLLEDYSKEIEKLLKSLERW